MKKQIIFIITAVIIVAIFAACSAKDSDEDMLTTAVTDANGVTQYYEVITEDSGETRLKPVQDKKGNEKQKRKTLSTTKKQSLGSDKDSNNDDNVVSFNPADTTTGISDNTAQNTTEKSDESTTDSRDIEEPTQKETQLATDKDGWITKWY